MKYVKVSDTEVVREDGLIIRLNDPNRKVPEWVEYEEWAKTNTPQKRLGHQEWAKLNDLGRRRLKHLR